MSRNRISGLTNIETLVYLQGLLLMLVLGIVLGHSYWPQTDIAIATATPGTTRATVAPGNVRTSLPDTATIAANPATAATTPLPRKPEPAPTPKPSTSEPDLVLRGIFVMAGGRASMALIEDSQGQQKLYKEGQKINDHLTLHSVSEKEITLEKDGVSVTLPLKRGESSPTNPKISEKTDIGHIDEQSAQQQTEEAPASVQLGTSTAGNSESPDTAPPPLPARNHL